MSARVFIHPRCHDGQGAGMLSHTLMTLGLDVSNLAISPPDVRKRCELVRVIDTLPTARVLERMDGSRYTHHFGWPAPVYA